MIERIRKWTDESERAVSPVIGVILMVAITVILAAVIGSFVLGLGQNLGNSGPQVSLSISDSPATYNSSGGIAIEINHNNGASLDISNLKIAVKEPTTGAVVASFSGDTNNASKATFKINNNNITNVPSFTAGDLLTITDDNTDIKDGSTYKVVVIDLQSGDTIASATVEVR